MATFLTRALAIGPRPEHVVRVLYTVPADRQVSDDSREGIRRAVEHVQSWYHQQLGGATFSLHDPIVEHCRMSQPEDFYARGHAWNKVVEGVQHCAPVSGWAAGGTHDNPGSTTTWVIYPDVEEACDEYHQFGEAGHELGRGGWGMTLLSRDDIEGVTDLGGSFTFVVRDRTTTHLHAGSVGWRMNSATRWVSLTRRDVTRACPPATSRR